MSYFLTHELVLICMGSTCSALTCQVGKGLAGLAAVCPCLFRAGVGATAVYLTYCEEIITLLLNYLGLHTSELTSLYKIHLASNVAKLLE